MKRILSMMAILCLALTATACGGSESSHNPLQGIVDKNSSDDHSSFAEVGETTENSFFAWTVHDIAIAKEYEGYPAAKGYKYVIADITVKNISDQLINVGNYDYMIAWGEGDDEMDYAYESFGDEMFPDDMDLRYKKEVSGKLVFEVPINASDLYIIYEEVYEDNSVGDVYIFHHVLKTHPKNIRTRPEHRAGFYLCYFNHRS